MSRRAVNALRGAVQHCVREYHAARADLQAAVEALPPCPDCGQSWTVDSYLQIPADQRPPHITALYTTADERLADLQAAHEELRDAQQTPQHCGGCGALIDAAYRRTIDHYLGNTP